MASNAKRLPHPAHESGHAGLLGRLLGTRSRMQTHAALWGWLFALPWVVGLIVFWGGPIIASFWLSFTQYDTGRSAVFIGLANYVKAFTNDQLFWPSLGRTFYFTLLFVPTSIIGSLLLALLLNQKLRGTNILRTIYFMPHLVPAVALAVTWLYLLHPRLGPVNSTLMALGMENPPRWLGSSASALDAVTMINVWAAVGGNTMLIFLAALQGVPQDYYEAADMDGAGPWHKFWGITLPLISPSVFFNLVLAIIAALKVFTTAWVTNQGGPSYATWFYLIHIYVESFQNGRMGYGSALAWILAVILVVFTLIQNWTSKRWVHYESD